MTESDARPGDRVRFLLVTGGGLGLAPVASGTFGSLGGIALAVLLQVWLSGMELAGALLGLAAVLLWVGCSMTEFSERTFLKKDPKPFVLDEIVGYLVALSIYVAVYGGQPTWLAHAACFFWFRAFDVMKTFPANRLEMLPGAPGIMLDDVMAGVYAGAVMLLLGRFVEL
jgi:phosphatidylglycerophosphatase A